MATKQVRIGVIGTSWWVDLMYVPSLTSHPAAKVVAVCGRDQKRAAEVAGRFGAAEIFADYRQMLAANICDAVVISTPDDLHCEMAMAALDAGLHVLCEKPLAGNRADAARMLERARNAGTKHMVLFTWRWQPHWRYVKDLVDSGYVGRCRYAEFRFVGGFALEAGYKWRFDGRRANGVTGDLGSHMIDFARWYLGEVTAVRADLRAVVDQSTTATPSPPPANDLGFLSLDFASGARGEIVASAVNIVGDETVRINVAIYGDEGSIEIEHRYFGVGANISIRGIRAGEESFSAKPIPDSYFEGGVDRANLFDPYLKQSAGPRAFIDAILDDRPAVPGFDAGVHVQEVVDAALASAAGGGGWVSL